MEAIVSKERERTTLADKLPEAITGFLEAFEGMDVRQQKAHLQTILKSATVYRDDRVELVFRE